MQVENQNIIFTVFNKNLVYTLAVFEIISAVIVALFFTVIRAEYIVLVLPFVFFVFVLPIFMIGMRNKIIYRFTPLMNFNIVAKIHVLLNGRILNHFIY